ncbi:hypothetical protein FGB62_47g016 [Gracilaria domingensis]|nr:hypothetical protein FGB62_47g016 [Gracilaria domingensis]
MPRRSSRPSGGRRPAPARTPARPPARSASTRTRPAPSPTQNRARSTAPATKKSAAAPPPVPAQPAQQGSAMGGFMASVASTGLGVMAGRAMDRALFGGSGSAPEPVAEPMSAASPAPYEYSAEEQLPETVCAREVLEFKKCMERSGSDVAACQWNIDVLAACQRQQQELGFADAGRL